ncbi:multifunctional CCA tRNA nucleotidyl transferase/2'3'-cyclic phosphodiesterase/2'nucleotidase/phosphatase [Motiliproteus coralliicola]|uniref:CCA-adding enzyme n=1 Tax=Motiliproteus coralliicola TaxID=2283196 RepID=A0A369WDN7_9GAMM|nr:multifunctional CCA tRNA nucleotidyl transferase/2'3'-cyclic phosphodiesterase/2'nucleotidase/phosphatase [Motiliproteus coralliicola]RDE19872.1 multifunctional CCA tRNA nucleotidyl transferase/2'3'-cyclic phosphodiesterase/2'nucleotidase/phosphatase [Motiliproteus coralliicola]
MQTYLVGGAVRDRLLGIEVYDRDWVVVGASAEQMLADGFVPVGKDFPVFLHPQTHEEYALARTERKTGHGYGGFQFHAAPDVTLEQDLLRRDLTINAMAEDQQGRLIDPYGGQQDLAQRCLRHVSAAFAEDPLRVLRTARFQARFHRLGFHIATETLKLMAQLSTQEELQALSSERVWKETERALGEISPQQFFISLQQCGALRQLMPELDLNQSLSRLLQQAAAKELDDEVRWALLCHQIAEENALAQLQQRLKTPKRFQQGAQLLQRFHALLQQPLTADRMMALYQGLDLSRRPERLLPFTQACELIFEAQPESLERCRQLPGFVDGINRIQPRQLVQQGFKGAALGEELQRRRQEWLQQRLADPTDNQE